MAMKRPAKKRLGPAATLSRELALVPKGEILPSRKDWAHRITAAWRKSLDGILEAGQLLVEAKAELEHGAFLPMIEKDLPFGAVTAQRLMKIAQDKRLTKAAYTPHLPPSWMTLTLLTRLDDASWQAVRDMPNAEVEAWP